MSGSPHRGDAPAGGRGGESPFAGLSVRQPSRGYRFSIDAFLLADFAAGFCGRTVLELGTGSGVVLLLLSRLCPGLRRGVGVEIQRELWEFARRNFEENGPEGVLTAVHGDFRREPADPVPGGFDLVVSNPPFRKAGEGRTNPDPGKKIARHEVTCTLPDVFRAAGRHLSPAGRFAMIGLPRRLPEILSCAADAGIYPEKIRFVHPYEGRPANLLLFAGRRRKVPEMSILPPLAVYAGQGKYHPEVERIYRGITLP
ncbi:MAG: tRNA1(Val) (adenine(37)-N6)-methyltransferase [Deltaproteobacteria bacterium]|nr:methyltransferase [Candidatus Deferrimicrobiaceae bacterium]